MAFSKITYNGTTLMDVTGDTVAVNKLLSGITATDASGTSITGNIANGTGVTFSGKTATAAAGYYASAATANMGLATVTSGTATISSLTYTYNSTNSNFTVGGSANVSAPTVGTAGYISSSEGTKNAKSSGASVSATVEKIGITATNSVPSGKAACVTPSISKQSVPSGVTDAATSDAATTTAPSSGVYVAIKSAANTTTLTATPTVSSAGYGTATSGEFTATNATTTVGANASSTTYVKIKTATPAFDGGAISGSVTDITGSNVTLSNSNEGIAITSTASAGRAAVLYNGAVAGWVSKADNATALAATTSNTSLTSKTKYITAISLPPTQTNNFTVTMETATAAQKSTAGYLYLNNNEYRTTHINNDETGYLDITNNGDIDILNSGLNSNVTFIGASMADRPIIQNGEWVTPTYTTTGTASATFYVQHGPMYVEEDTAQITNKTRISVTPTTSDSFTSPYYLAVTGLVAGNVSGTTANITGTATTTASTAGYQTTGTASTGSITGTATGKTNAKRSSVYYLPVPELSLSTYLDAYVSNVTAPIQTNVILGGTNTNVTLPPLAATVNICPDTEGEPLSGWAVFPEDDNNIKTVSISDISLPNANKYVQKLALPNTMTNYITISGYANSKLYLTFGTSTTYKWQVNFVSNSSITLTRLSG